MDPGSAPSAPTLPAGLTTRPLTRADSRALADLIGAQELEDTGRVDIEEADLISDWAAPGHDLATSTIGVHDGDRLVAYAELMRHDRVDAAVAPDQRGRGIGTWLEAWLRELATARGRKVIGMPVPEGSAGDRLLAGLGWRTRWTSWALALPGDASIPGRDLPPGHVVRPAEPNELVALHDVLEDAFLEWSDRERETFEDFEAMTLQRPGFAPWNLRVVVDPDGAVVAGAVVHLTETGTAYVARLATRSDQRHRGLAQALLVDSFAAGRAHGASVSELSTDSRTGALRLYEKVGMVPVSVWVNRAVDL